MPRKRKPASELASLEEAITCQMNAVARMTRAVVIFMEAVKHRLPERDQPVPAREVRTLH